VTAQEIRWWPLRPWAACLVWYFARAVLRPTIAMLGFRVAGRRRIPRSGGVLVVVNHLADIDPPFMGMACVPRRAQYLADARHFTGRALAAVMFGVGAFPVRMGEPDVRAMRYAREQLEAGRVVVIFPEGTPSWGPEMGEFRDGVCILGLTPGVRVVPAAIWGTHHVMHGWRVTGRGPVHVAFGHPLAIPQEGSRRERAAELTARARAAVGELLEPMARARP
jgi:1-acyl-sn-glycerol-3-phosphate acyltransferase